jgi:hypothetical protein
MKVLMVVIALASLASSEPLRAYEHKLVDICGVRDLLEANCNGASDIDSCDKCVHEAVKVSCPATEPADCIALNKCINEMHFENCSDEDEREKKEQEELEAALQLDQQAVPTPKPKKPSQFLNDGLDLSLSGQETSSKAPYEDEDKDFVPDNDERFRGSSSQNNDQRFT